MEALRRLLVEWASRAGVLALLLFSGCVRDDFTAPDGSSLQPQWEPLGFGHVVDLIFEDAFVTNNQVNTAVPNSSGRTYRNRYDMGNLSHTVQASIIVGGLNGQEYGLLARMSKGYTSEEVDRYLFHYSAAASEPTFYLIKVVDGEVTILDSLVYDVGTGTHMMRFVISDTYKAGYVDGLLAVETTDNEILAGRPGIAFPHPGFHGLNAMDDFIVY